MNGCCSRLRPGHGIDGTAVERAIQGQTIDLTRDERKLVIWRLKKERGWGLDRISEHLGYSRTKVAEVLIASARGSQ